MNDERITILIAHHSSRSSPISRFSALDILTQFLLRLSFGLALAMAVTPWRLVTSGFYRVHLYVVLGLMTLATLVAATSPEEFSFWLPASAAALSYVGSVVWLYERPRPGVAILWVIAAIALAGAWSATPVVADAPTAARVLSWLTPPTAGLVLGVTLASMLLGHWYLNTPTMDLVPLRRLLLLLFAAIALRMAVCSVGLALELSVGDPLDTQRLLFALLRWLAGLVGVPALAWMAWQTLKIPNTQSATGILYVAIIGAFVGELTSQLLSVESVFPL